MHLLQEFYPIYQNIVNSKFSKLIEDAEEKIICKVGGVRVGAPCPPTLWNGNVWNNEKRT